MLGKNTLHFEKEQFDRLEVDCSNHKQWDVRKTSASNIREEAQKIADAMVAKKLKNMPSKQEVAEWKEIKASIQAKTRQLEEAKNNMQKATELALLLRKKAEATILAAKAGVAPDYIEDTVILALARSGGDGSIFKAIEGIVEKNPNWCIWNSLKDRRMERMCSEGDSDANTNDYSE